MGVQTNALAFQYHHWFLGVIKEPEHFNVNLRGIQCLIWTTFMCSDSHVATWNPNSVTTASLVYNSVPIIVQNTKLICFHESWVGLSSQRKLFSSSSEGKAKVWPSFFQELPTLASSTKSAFPSSSEKIPSKQCDLSYDFLSSCCSATLTSVRTSREILQEFCQNWSFRKPATQV